jgi:hypothetical protein
MGTWGIGPFDNDTAADEQGERFTNGESLYPVLTLFDAAAWTNLAGWRVSGARRTPLLERNTSPLLSTRFRDISADPAPSRPAHGWRSVAESRWLRRVPR